MTRVMRPILPLAAVVALGAALAPPAAGKEIGRVRVCGVDGCRDRTPVAPGEQAFETGALGGAAPRPQAFYVVRVDVRVPGQGLTSGWRFAFAPAAAAVRYEAEPGTFHWGRLSPAQAVPLRRLVRGVRPYPAARFPRTPRAAAAPTADAQPAAVVPPSRGGTGGRGDSGGGDVATAGVLGAVAAAAALGACTAAGVRRRSRRRDTTA
jgi:hypothetical protein